MTQLDFTEIISQALQIAPVYGINFPRKSHRHWLGSLVIQFPRESCCALLPGNGAVHCSQRIVLPGVMPGVGEMSAGRILASDYDGSFLVVLLLRLQGRSVSIVLDCA